MDAQIRYQKTHKYYEAYLKAQMRYLARPTHRNWNRKEALMEAYHQRVKVRPY